MEPVGKGNEETCVVGFSLSRHVRSFPFGFLRKSLIYAAYALRFLAERNGHPPLIPEGSFTTSLPVGDLDEATFMPGSTFLPVVRLRATMSSNEDDLDGWHPTVFKYFVLRCQ